MADDKTSVLPETSKSLFAAKPPKPLAPGIPIVNAEPAGLEKGHAFFEDFKTGMSFSSPPITVTSKAVDEYLKITDDRAAVTESEVHSKAAGFEGRVAPAALVNAIISGSTLKSGPYAHTFLSVKERHDVYAAPILIGRPLSATTSVVRREDVPGQNYGYLLLNRVLEDTNGNLLCESRIKVAILKRAAGDAKVE